MSIWVLPKDNRLLVFFVLPNTADTDPLAGFHISLTTGYVESVKLFCIITHTITYIANSSWSASLNALIYHLDNVVDTRPDPTNDAATRWLEKALDCDLNRPCHNLPTNTTSCLLAYVDVYMGEFCALTQGISDICVHTRRHLFHCINLVFCPNDADNHARQDPNSLKNIYRGYAACTANKSMLG